MGDFTKLDAHVHIAHNCSVGANCRVCAQSGIAGSSILEDAVWLGGQVGIGDHTRVGKKARLGAQSGTSQDIPENATYFGTPALPIHDALSLSRRLRRLKGWQKKIEEEIQFLHERCQKLSKEEGTTQAQ